MLQIPVYVGCNKPLLGEIKPNARAASSTYHGKDGLGDVPDSKAPDDSHLQSEHGVQALIRLSKELAGMTELGSVKHSDEIVYRRNIDVVQMKETSINRFENKLFMSCQVTFSHILTRQVRQERDDILLITFYPTSTHVQTIQFACKVCLQES